ncbi:hypothetical protein pneo_cds_94 [Pandoravirus neocaledonia]|uniref:Uncharacterized protein n=1 Tax=Pandoravirus neocaledonia TaxID=2107708 RepID=A0A2U7UB65_9VIRU|nr:hypothetical protein pneo_cds_94 [Pandoravirus neocaledonia]AVK75701.1 hypothetical protein pneo_cds_94 [Pandoravirus neocaledonia]
MATPCNPAPAGGHAIGRGLSVRGRFVCARCAGPLLAVGFWPGSARFVGHAQGDDDTSSNAGSGLVPYGGAHCTVCGTQRQTVESVQCDALFTAPSGSVVATTSGSTARAALLPPQEEVPPPRRSICLLM